MKYYYISGTSRGIGKALCEELLKKEDSFIFGLGRNRSIEHRRYEHITIDLSHTEELEHFHFSTPEDASEVILVNNAGSLGDIKHIGDIDPKTIDQSIKLNLIAPAMLMNAFIRDHKDTQLKILNISSGAASRSIESWSSYCASKAGLEMFAQVADLDLQTESRNDIKIWSIAPGVIETQMQEIIRSSDEKDFSGVDHFRQLKEEMRLKSPNKTAQELVKIIEGNIAVEGVIGRLD